MKGIHNYFSISTVHKNLEDMDFVPGSILFHGQQDEERSFLSGKLTEKNVQLEIVSIEETDNQEISIFISDQEKTLSLRSQTDAIWLIDLLEKKNVYLDITGLTHSTWAWMVRALLSRKEGETFVLYSEPMEYKFHDNPVDGQIFDLSNKISGVSPLPGFVRLGTYNAENSIFMPLLGFEGTRLSYIIEDVQPLPENTFPVVGIPGFKHDYPFFTYQGNKNVLEREGIWKNRRYEQANCPVSIYILGTRLLEDNPMMALRIAPIGTKPHALGAVLLKLTNPNRVDLVYDHPIRKKKRTKGRSNTICYRLSPFKEKIVLT